MRSLETIKYIINEILAFLTNKKFILHLLGIFLFLTIVLVGVFTWLRFYTHHGQKLELPNYVDQSIDEVIKDAKIRSFEIIVNDSVHIVGKPGGLIQNQNPPGGSLVKEKRKIYVTTTKFLADEVNISDIRFFGENYDQIENALLSRGIRSAIRSYSPDYLTENAVMEVWYNEQLVVNRDLIPESFVVDKGSTLEFVVSSSEGVLLEVPALIGKTISSANLLLQAGQFQLDILNDGQSTGQSIIIDQDPPAGTSIEPGSVVTVQIESSE